MPPRVAAQAVAWVAAEGTGDLSGVRRSLPLRDAIVHAARCCRLTAAAERVVTGACPSVGRRGAGLSYAFGGGRARIAPSRVPVTAPASVRHGGISTWPIVLLPVCMI